MATATSRISHPSQTFEPLENAPPNTSASSRQEDFIPSGDTVGVLTFYSPPADGSRPYNYVEEPPAGTPRRNYGGSRVPAQVRDLNFHPEFTPNLHDNAFEIIKAATAMKDFDDDARIRDEYYKEVEQVILKHV